MGMYSLITPEPGKIARFVFEAKHVYATLETDTDTNEYNVFHLNMKSKKMGLKSLLDASSTLAWATKLAKSGMNLAMMMAYGQDEDYRSALRKIKVLGADPEAVANMFRFCKGSTPGQDPKCKGS